MKYLLSTGETTSKVEKYILDLFKVYLTVMPNDIPGNPDLGFNYNFIGIPKDELRRELTHRVGEIVNKMKNQFSGVSIELTNCQLVSESRAYVTISVSGSEEEDFEIKL